MPDVKMMTVESDGTVTMGLDLAAPELTGFDALFQRTILTMMQSPGSDVQNGDGGGLQNLFLAGIGGDEAEILAESAEVVRRTRRSLSIEQDRANLPAVERMKEFAATDVFADTSSATLSLTVRLVNGTNQTANRTIVVG